MNIGEFHCACRFYRAEEFGAAELVEACSYHAKRVTLSEEDRRLISTAAVHLMTWATSNNKEPYGNTADVAKRLEALLNRSYATGGAG